MKLRSTLLAAFAAFVAPALRAQETAPSTAMLRLKSGAIQWGTIQSHDPEGFVFQRLDTGGVVRLDWSLLDPVEEKELRQRFGYVDLTSEETLVSADRIVTVKGLEFVGRIVDRTADAILMKTASATIPIPKSEVAQASDVVQVPARDVYTLEELYGQALGRHDVSKAEGNFRVAQDCEGVFDFAHAIQHYKKAAELDPAFKPQDVAQALARAEEKAKAQAELEYLSEVDQLTKRNKFDEALARADAFKEKFPQSALLPEAKKKHDRVIKARTEFLSKEVVRAWNFHLGRLARDAASKPLEEVMAYLDDKLKQDIAAATAKDLVKISKEANEDTARQLWKGRKKIRYLTASYGLGTWLLGKAAALRGYDESGNDGENKPESEQDKARADLANKIKRFLEAQEVARRALSADEKKEDREGFWKEFPFTARTNWIVAYYVENSGDFEVAPKPIIQACQTCGGKGILEYALAGANVSRSAVGKQSTDLKKECDSCHGIGAVRRILYR
ncbi:MAG: hypothetical protein IPJ77_08065 [Planctomycetes bacterium]|nr:hypothetical protein [Planctomycetota bacterium]